jgi:hypothetical protein
MSHVVTRFYLTMAGENRELAEPRECRPLRMVSGPHRDDYMLVEINPPLIREQPHRGITSKLVLATVFLGTSLFDEEFEFPGWVYVTDPMSCDVLAPGGFSAEKIRYLGKGSIHLTRTGAEEVADSYRARGRSLFPDRRDAG